MAVLDSKNFTISTPATRATRGKLVKVEIAPGRLVKMSEQDAIDKGLIKKRQPPQNKMIAPPPDNNMIPVPVTTGNKADDKPIADDFSSIPGIGAASARAIIANGITTLAQLRNSECKFLSVRAREAIEAWKNK